MTDFCVLIGKQPLFHDEFSSEIFYTKISRIINNNKDNDLLIRMCCAVLAVYSYDANSILILTTEEVINTLFITTKIDDLLIKELIATTLCNISINEICRKKLVNYGVVEILSTLSGTTSETIQELCAKCICNLTCSIDLHSIMLSFKLLQTILMISLVRSVGIITKQLCAKALLNLITDNNIPALRESGAIRVFATLSSLNDQLIRNICARGFLLFTITPARCEELIQRRAVLSSLFSMVKGKSNKTRTIVGIAVCNLLGSNISQKAAISAGALSVLKIISTMAYDDLKEATARVVISIMNVPSLHTYLQSQPVVPMLMMIVQQSIGYTFDCAIHALACMSQYEIFRNILIDKGCITVIVNATINGIFTSIETANEICRCMCLLSYQHDRADVITKQGHILYALHVIFKSNYCSNESAKMMTIIIRNLSFESNVRSYLINRDAVGLLGNIMLKHTEVRQDTFIASIIALYNLVLESNLHESLINQGFVNIFSNIISIEAPANQLSMLTARSNETIVEVHNENDIMGEMFGGGSIDTYEIPEDNVNLKPFDINPTPILTTTTSNKHRRKIRPSRDFTNKNLQQIQIQPIKSQSNSPNRNDNINSNATVRTLDVILSTEDVNYLCKTVELMSETVSCRQALVDGKLLDIFDELYPILTETAREDIACTIANISSTKDCRQQLIKQGVCELLIKLSHTTNIETQNKCSLALGYLSEITQLSFGIVQSMLMLSLKEEETSNGSTDNTIRNAIMGINSLSNDTNTDYQLQFEQQQQQYTSQQLTLSETKSIRELIRNGLRRRRESSTIFMKKSVTDKLRAIGGIESYSNDNNSNDMKRNNNNNNSNIELIEPIIINNYLNINYIKKEINLLLNNYKTYEFEIIGHIITNEIGGIADDFDIQLTLPIISSNRVLNTMNRSADMFPVVLPIISLPKDKSVYKEDISHLLDNKSLSLNSTATSTTLAMNNNLLDINNLQQKSNVGFTLLDNKNSNNNSSNRNITLRSLANPIMLAKKLNKQRNLSPGKLLTLAVRKNTESSNNSNPNSVNDGSSMDSSPVSGVNSLMNTNTHINSKPVVLPGAAWNLNK